MLNTSLLCRPARPDGFIHFDHFCWAFLVSWVHLCCTCDYYKNSFYPTIAQWNNLPPEIIASTSPCSFGQSLGNLTLFNFMLWFFHYCNFLKQSVIRVKTRLRIVFIFSSGICVSPFSREVIFTRARVSLSLYYIWRKMGTTFSLSELVNK